MTDTQLTRDRDQIDEEAPVHTDRRDARRFRASTYDDALAAATDELGPGVQVVEANRIRRGGLGGFFATDLGVEVTVVPDEPIQDTTGGGSHEFAELDRASIRPYLPEDLSPDGGDAGSLAGQSLGMTDARLQQLLDRAEKVEQEQQPHRREVDVATESPTFAEHLVNETRANDPGQTPSTEALAALRSAEPALALDGGHHDLDDEPPPPLPRRYRPRLPEDRQDAVARTAPSGFLAVYPAAGSPETDGTDAGLGALAVQDTGAPPDDRMSAGEHLRRPIAGVDPTADEVADAPGDGTQGSLDTPVLHGPDRPIAADSASDAAASTGGEPQAGRVPQDPFGAVVEHRMVMRAEVPGTGSAAGVQAVARSAPSGFLEEYPPSRSIDAPRELVADDPPATADRFDGPDCAVVVPMAESIDEPMSPITAQPQAPVATMSAPADEPVAPVDEPVAPVATMSAPTDKPLAPTTAQQVAPVATMSAPAAGQAESAMAAPADESRDQSGASGAVLTWSDERSDWIAATPPNVASAAARTTDCISPVVIESPDTTTADATELGERTRFVADATDRLVNELGTMIASEGSRLNELDRLRVAVTTAEGSMIEMTLELADDHD